MKKTEYSDLPFFKVLEITLRPQKKKLIYFAPL